MKKQSISRMLCITFLLGIFMNIHHPVTPTLFSEMNLPSRIFGTSFAAMCFFSFLTSLFWGEMSDHKGRLKVFAISCCGYGIGQFSLGFCTSEWTVLLSRSFSGAFAAGAQIASLAYVADLYAAEERGKGMSIYIAIQSVSLAVGYLIGGVLGSISFHLAFSIQGMGMILLALLSLLWLQESLSDIKAIQTTQLLRSINPFMSFINARSLWNKAMMVFLIIVVCSSFGSVSYDNAFNYYLKDQMDFIPIYNGILKAIVGLIGLIANMSINMWIIKKTDIRRSLAVVLSLCALSAFIGIFLTDILWLFLIFNLFFYTVNAIYQPIVQTLSVEKRNDNEIGIVSGLVNAIKSLGNVAGSLCAGMVYDMYTLAPFIIASLFFMIAALFGYRYDKMK